MRGLGGWRRRVLLAGGTVAAAVAACLWLVVSSSAGSTSPADRAATDAYLMAVRVYAQADLTNARASRAAAQAIAAKIGSECPGALKGAPPERSSGVSFAQQIGESNREDEQLSQLEAELARAVTLSLEQPDRPAFFAFAETVRSLRWSDPNIVRVAASELSEVEERFSAPVPAVCADIKAWVSSGYKTLSPATKELQAKQEEASKRAQARSTQSFSRLLAGYEGPAEKALIAKNKNLSKAISKALGDIDSIYRHLESTVGVTRHIEPTIGHPSPGAVVLGKGKTATGEEFEVLLEPKNSGPERCSAPRPLDVRIVGGGVSGCYARSEASMPPSVECRDGFLTIEARTLPAARAARLRLSDGRQITSRIAVLPARLGGPTGIYFQTVRGPSPIPVSLTELDQHGRTLRAWKLHRVSGCTKHELKFLPGGIRTLVRDRVPQGPSFSIVGEAYRFIGKIHFALKVDVPEAGGSGESPSGQKPSLFSWALDTGCKPTPFAILYGLLKDSNDTVLARTSGTLTPLRRVSIPAHLHAGGLLVYIASPTVPSELIVQSSNGSTILTEHLGHLGTQAQETCKGETESG